MPYVRFRVVDKKPVGTTPPNTNEVEGWFGDPHKPQQMSKAQTTPQEVTMSVPTSVTFNGPTVDVMVQQGHQAIQSHLADKYTISNLQPSPNDRELVLTIERDGRQVVTVDGHPDPSIQVHVQGGVHVP